jgi:hypothetical protein
VYQKANGDYFCGFIIKDDLTWYQADEKCRSRGGRLPEIYSIYENIDLLQFKVILDLYFHAYCRVLWGLNKF